MGTTKAQVFEFLAFDTLFFREARPMESVGATPLAGRFPPTARTMSGVVRSLVGGAMRVDWQSYRAKDPSQSAVSAVIGEPDQDSMGGLDLRGPYPMQSGQRLYPVPLHLICPNIVAEGGADNINHMFLSPSDTPTCCDLGTVCLPMLAKEHAGARPYGNAWLTQADLFKVLSKQPPDKIIDANELFSAEARLGIALNSQRRSTEQGKLYQTVHARLHEGSAVSLGVEVSGIPENIQAEAYPRIHRMGGEGRFVEVEVKDKTQAPDSSPPSPPDKINGIVLVLLTHANFTHANCDRHWVLPGFIPSKIPTDSSTNHSDVWKGSLQGIELTLRSMVLGQAVREGGWNLQAHQSRPAVSLVPAGSVYFCTVDNDKAVDQAISALQGQKLGSETAIGRGEIAVGYW